MRFTKMHGAGNDYVYVNLFDQTVDDPAACARAVSDRHTGIGSDGLILLSPVRPGVDADVRMRMFNADGSEAEMCGNGIRCLCKLAHDHGLCTANPMRIETGNGVLSVAYTTDAGGKVDQVTVDMGAPIVRPQDVPVDTEHLTATGQPQTFELSSAANDRKVTATFVSMGNPHAVVYCPKVAEVPLDRFGSDLETHVAFPQRINVHIVQVNTPTELTMRSWERGSGLTQACGTGAAAVCVAGVLTGRSERHVLIHLPGGDLKLEWRQADNHVYLTGPAVEVFTGVWPA